jgi:prevent-host-death family protein
MGPEMKTVSDTDVSADWSAYLEQCQTEGPIVITQNGKRVAVLLAPRDDDLERLVLAHSPHFQALLDQSRQSISAGKGLSRDAFWETVERRHEEKEQGSRS